MLQKQYELLLQQLDGQQKESRVHRESFEKSRQELLIMKHQMESGSASIRGELESSKAEVAHLKQIIEALRAELEKIKKENSEVTLLFEQEILSTTSIRIFLLII